MDTETVLLGALIAFAAAATQSVTGFGFAVMTAPLLALVWSVKPAVSTTVLLSLWVNILVLAQVRGHIDYGRLPGMYAGFLAGSVPGILFLQAVSADVLQITVGVVVLVATVLIAMQSRVRLGRDSFARQVVAGALSGASGSATSMGGPPVALYLMGREPDMHRFRATLLAFFLPASVVTLSVFIAIGRIDGDVLTVAAAGVPAIVAGVIVGAWLRDHTDTEMFRRLVIGLLVCMSVLVISFTVLGRG